MGETNRKQVEEVEAVEDEEVEEVEVVFAMARSFRDGQKGIAKSGGIQPTVDRSKMAKTMGRSASIRNGGGPFEAEVLRIGNAAVSIGDAAHGTHAQLHDWGCGGAREAHAWIQRDSSDGLGRFWTARGKCRNKK